jgi:hypothetical protein
VEGLKNILNKLALMGLSPGAFSAVPTGLVLPFNPTQHYVLGYSQPSLRDSIVNRRFSRSLFSPDQLNSKFFRDSFSPDLPNNEFSAACLSNSATIRGCFASCRRR